MKRCLDIFGLRITAGLAAMFALATGAIAAEWTVVNLHPPGATSSLGLAVDGDEQVGTVRTGGITRAALWSGTAASWVDLYPATSSQCVAVDRAGAQQAGNATVAGVLFGPSCGKARPTRGWTWARSCRRGSADPMPAASGSMDVPRA